MKTNKAFTLIEMLVVVLIVGVLAAVALPQYQRAVEQTNMTEAAVVLRSIANANQVYYLETGEYAGPNDMDKLNVNVPGQISKQIKGENRVATKSFIYSPTGSDLEVLALAQRADNGVWRGTSKGYYMSIPRSDPGTIRCHAYNEASDMEKELCNQINEDGSL